MIADDVTGFGAIFNFTSFKTGLSRLMLVDDVFAAAAVLVQAVTVIALEITLPALLLLTHVYLPGAVAE